MKLSLLSKYRTHIMGAAMMWVMYFHSYFVGKEGGILNFIHDIGFYGVDMFLLVSGMGLYFSMRKSKGLGDFYQKRAVRILPAYLIVTLCWYLLYKTEVNTGDMILSITGINYFRGTIYGRPEYFDWFIPTLIVFYLLIPLYDRLFQRAKVKWKFTFLACLISPILCIVTYQFHALPLYGSIVRIPVFLIGYCIGYFLYEKKEESEGSWMVYLPLMITGLICGYYIQKYITNYTVFWGINAYPATLVAPGLSILLALVFLYAEKYLRIAGKVLLFPFYVCGRYSLEIYLIHQRLMSWINGESAAQLRGAIYGKLGNWGYYFLIALASVALAALLHELISLAIKGIKKLSASKQDGEIHAAQPQ